MLQALIDKSQELVTGRVTVKLYKGNVTIIGRESPIRSMTRNWSPSKRARSPTTTATPPASSSSTPCACAWRPSGIGAPGSRAQREPSIFRYGYRLRTL
ncbi:MAG: hypothetical protein WDN45_14835 [Caulobacteraceae bacterium]